MRLYEAVISSMILHLYENANDVDKLTQEAAKIKKIVDLFFSQHPESGEFLIRYNEPDNLAVRLHEDIPERPCRFWSDVLRMLSNTPNDDIIQRIRELGREILKIPLEHERFFRSQLMSHPEAILRTYSWSRQAQFGLAFIVGMMIWGDLQRLPELTNEMTKEEFVWAVKYVFDWIDRNYKRNDESSERCEVQRIVHMLIGRIDLAISLQDRLEILKNAIYYKQDWETIELLLSKIKEEWPLEARIEVLRMAIQSANFDTMKLLLSKLGNGPLIWGEHNALSEAIYSKDMAKVKFFLEQDKTLLAYVSPGTIITLFENDAVDEANKLFIIEHMLPENPYALDENTWKILFSDEYCAFFDALLRKYPQLLSCEFVKAMLERGQKKIAEFLLHKMPFEELLRNKKDALYLLCRTGQFELLELLISKLSDDELNACLLEQSAETKNTLLHELLESSEQQEEQVNSDPFGLVFDSEMRENYDLTPVLRILLTRNISPKVWQLQNANGESVLQVTIEEQNSSAELLIDVMDEESIRHSIYALEAGVACTEDLLRALLKKDIKLAILFLQENDPHIRFDQFCGALEGISVEQCMQMYSEQYSDNIDYPLKSILLSMIGGGNWEEIFMRLSPLEQLKFYGSLIKHKSDIPDLFARSKELRNLHEMVSGLHINPAHVSIIGRDEQIPPLPVEVNYDDLPMLFENFIATLSDEEKRCFAEETQILLGVTIPGRDDFIAQFHREPTPEEIAKSYALQGLKLFAETIKNKTDGTSIPKTRKQRTEHEDFYQHIEKYVGHTILYLYALRGSANLEEHKSMINIFTLLGVGGHFCGTGLLEAASHAFTHFVRPLMRGVDEKVVTPQERVMKRLSELRAKLLQPHLDSNMVRSDNVHYHLMVDMAKKRLGISDTCVYRDEYGPQDAHGGRQRDRELYDTVVREYSSNLSYILIAAIEELQKNQDTISGREITEGIILSLMPHDYDPTQDEDSLVKQEVEEIRQYCKEHQMALELTVNDCQKLFLRRFYDENYRFKPAAYIEILKSWGVLEQ